MIPPTITIAVSKAIRHAQDRAARLERTQQLELNEDLYIRIAPGGRKFLLFQLEGLPTKEQAQDIARVMELHNPIYDWYQGNTLRSLTVIETNPELNAEV